MRLSLLAIDVQAQGDSRADALIDQGVERRRAGDDEGALALFVRAWEASPTPRALAQIALAEQALGHFVEAEAHLLEALSATEDEWIAPRRADLQIALEEIQLRLGYLEVRGGTEGAELRIDGHAVGTLPIDEPIRLATGSYRMEVVAPRHYPVARQITIVAEGTTRESVMLTPRPSAPLSEEAESSPRRRARGQRVRPIVAASLVAGGGALLVTSAATFALRQRRADEYNSDACLVGGATRGENCGGLFDGAVRAQRTSAATLTLGAAFAFAGGLMFVIGPDDRDETASRAASRELACGASLGSTWGGRCRLRF